MPKDFKELKSNSNNSSIEAAILELTPLMSKRMARLLNTKAKKRAERNAKLLTAAKTDKEVFILTYNLVVQMREQRVEKTIKIFRLIAEWAKKFKNVENIEDVVGVFEDALEK